MTSILVADADEEMDRFADAVAVVLMAKDQRVENVITNLIATSGTETGGENDPTPVGELDFVGEINAGGESKTGGENTPSKADLSSDLTYVCRRLTHEELVAFDRLPRFVNFVAEAADLTFPCEAQQTWRVGKDRLSVRWWRDSHDDVWKLAIRSGWPGPRPRKALGLVEVWVASQTCSLATRKAGADGKPDYTAEGGPALARLKLLALVKAGILRPAPVRLRRLPDEAPMSARLLWFDVIQPLLQIRRIDPEDGDGVPLARDWLAQRWAPCTGAFLTEGQAEYGKRWLRDHGYIVSVGKARSRRGGMPTTLWRVALALPETLL